MAITKEKKTGISDKLEKIAEESGSVAFVNFHGLGMADTMSLREALREKGVEYYVAKKTLIKRTFNDDRFKGGIPNLEGEIAVVWSSDALAPSREIYNFSKKSKKLKKKLSLVGGVFEGVFKDSTEILAIATIPPLEVLRGMFVNVINSPIQRTAIALGQIAQSKN